MLLSTLKHYLYDIALNAMFDKILFNFPTKQKFVGCTVNDIKNGDYIRLEYMGKYSEGYIVDIQYFIQVYVIKSSNKDYIGVQCGFNSTLYAIYKLE